MMKLESSSSKADLMPSFISAMKTLFDIMDSNKSGVVKFSDIENRWQEDPRKGLPKGVIENLRKVTPPSGNINFSQFCAGLKLSLTKVPSDGDQRSDINNNCNEAVRHRPASVPVPSFSHPSLSNSKEQVSGTKTTVEEPKELQKSVPSRPLSSSRLNTARVKPNNAVPHRTISMPHLGANKHANSSQSGDEPTQSVPPFISPPPFIAPPPVKPSQSSSYRNLKQRNQSEPSIPSCPPSALNKSGIMTVLQKWRLEKLKESKDVDYADSDVPRNDNQMIKLIGSSSENALNAILKAPPKPPRGLALYKTDTEFNSDSALKGVPMKKNYNRRREPRRHTLANGIDYNMLKRMKQMEQEKDVLVQGLESVERAREWYMKQIQTVQDKMKYIGKSGTYVEHSSDIYQERLNFQMARIFEVNQHLSALVESTEKGFPLHMNLALRQPSIPKPANKNTNNDGTVQHLKEQNYILTEEIGKKGDRITQLEREKAALIRELFQARSQHRREPDDNTLI